MTPPAFAAGRSFEARRGRRSPGPAPDAAFPIPPSREQALFNAARSRACPHGLPARPRSHARHRPGLSVRGGPMRAHGATHPGLIHQLARGLTSSPMCGTPQRRAGISTLRGRRNARTGPDHVFIFKTDRAGPGMPWHREPLGRRRAIVVGRGGVDPDHPASRDGIRGAADLR